jgi:hypothetical protein
MTPRRRRLLAGLGLLIPGAGLIFASAFIVLGGVSTQQCGSGVTPAPSSGCTTDSTGISLVTFPGALICLVLSAAVLRGARWVRWPAVVVGAVLATMTAAASVAVIVALIDEAQVRGAVVLGILGAVLTVVIAMPAVLLGAPEGIEALPGTPRRDGSRGPTLRADG